MGTELDETASNFTESNETRYLPSVRTAPSRSSSSLRPTGGHVCISVISIMLNFAGFAFQRSASHVDYSRQGNEVQRQRPAAENSWAEVDLWRPIVCTERTEQDWCLSGLSRGMLSEHTPPASICLTKPFHHPRTQRLLVDMCILQLLPEAAGSPSSIGKIAQTVSGDVLDVLLESAIASNALLHPGFKHCSPTG